MKLDDALLRMDILKGWEICEEVGRGGSGAVFRVRSRRTGEYAALKWIRLKRDDAASQESFLESQRRILDEISTLHKLSDIPLVVSIQDYAVADSADGRAWNALIRMEFLTPLLDCLSKETFTLRMALGMAFDIALALEKCHQRGVVHGDIKPENILVGNGVFKLADFGISTALDDLNLLQARAGTRAYQPPEYSLGGKPTPQGDIYSLGIMLYLLLNDGLLPFQQGYAEEDRRQAVEERCRRVENGDFGLYALPRAASAALGQVVCLACAPDPQDRFKDTRAFAAALEAAQSRISPEEEATPITFPGIENVGTDGVLQPGNVPTDELIPPESAELQPDSEVVEAPEPGAQSPAPDDRKRPPRPIRDPAPAGERKAPFYRRKWFKMVCAAVVIVGIITSVTLFLVSRPVPPLRAEVIPSAFSADIVSAGGRGDLTLYPAARPDAARRVARADLPVKVDDLVPSTAYVLSDGRHQMRFDTTGTDDSAWARGEARVYTASRAGIEAVSEYGEVDLGGYVLSAGTPAQGGITLENQARQGVRAFLVCTAEYLGELPGTEVPMVAVLRLGNGETYRSRQDCVLTDASCLLLAEITGLFEERYNAHGAQFYGGASLELYVNGGQAGYVEISIGKENAED